MGLKKIFKSLKILVIFLCTFIILVAMLSLSPKESVRLRIAMDGHPLIAIKCNPKYFSKSKKYFKEPVYSIESEYGYAASDGSYEVYNFKVQKRFVFNYAKHIVPSV